MLPLIANAAINASMYWNQYKLRKPLLKAASQTRQSQLQLLQHILAHNAQTQFGRDFDFSNIKTLKDYQRTVPIQTYDSLAPYIQKQLHANQALTTDPPVYYARTSGTTGGHKDIPLTDMGIKQVRHAQKQLSISLWKDTSFLSGSILGFASAAEEGQLENGCSYGSVSGSTYKSVSRVVADKFVVPSSVFSLKDVNAKYQAYALATLGSNNLTGIVAANPSSILKLVKIIEQSTADLLHVLSGEQSSWLLPETKAVLTNILKRIDNNRIARLNKSYQQSGKLTPIDVFPALSAIATWTGGSCGIALRQLMPYLPSTEVVEYGYGASEFMGSVNVDAKNNLCLPQLNHHFYEFVKLEDWDSEHPVFYGAHELTEGEDYYVVVTTQSGLYRYNINDIVRSGPTIRQCATLSFLQKGQGVTNITGEKLSEHQLIQVMRSVITDHDLNSGGYMALANEEQSRYDLYIEYDNKKHLRELTAEIDNKLRAANIEYDDKRASGRLHAIQVHCLQNNACEQVKIWSVESGVREAQYKPTVLAYARDWAERMQLLVQKEST